MAQLSKRNASVSGAGGELGQFLAVSAMTTAEWLTSIYSIASDANLSDRILRTMHTMKSNATMHNQIPMSEKIHEIETKALAFMQKISSGAKVNKDCFTELHSLIKALHTSLLGNLAGAPLKKISSRKSEDPAVAVLENALNSVDSVCKDLADIVSNAEASGKAFRELHTMKGLAAMNNLGALVDVLHKTEGTLDAICKNLSIAKAVGAEQRDQLLSELKSVRFIVEREIDRKRKRFSDAA